MLQVEKTKIEGCYILTPSVFNDNRGYFTVSYNSDELNKVIGKEINFVQDNKSYSKYGVIRGLHFQKQPYSQTKLVSCVYGSVRDVIVDIRKDSPTYGQHITIDLIAEEHKMILIPNWCAHGFSILSDGAIFQYKVDNYWNKDAEECIVYNDPDLGIDWNIPSYIRNLSQKDMEGKFLKDINF